MDNPPLDIVTDLTLDEVVRRLREAILEPRERQTQYYQKFVGHIHHQGAKFSSLAGRNTVFYELSFGTLNGQTLISLSNSVYQNRLVASALVKGMITPMGFIILIMGCVFYSSWQQLIVTTVISAIIITLCLMFKADPVTREEYLSDLVVREIIKTINGHVL